MFDRDSKIIGNLYRMILENQNTPEENPYPKMGLGDVDADFEVGETNFPHGNGYPNTSEEDEEYDKVVRLDYIHLTNEVDDNDAYDAKIRPTLVQVLSQHYPSILEQLKRSGYTNEDLTLDSVTNAFYHRNNDSLTPEQTQRFESFLEQLYIDSPTNSQNPANYPVFVSLYDISRRLGGGEEGGWWYDHYDPIETYKASNYSQAEKIAKHLYNKISNLDLDGKPRIILEKKAKSQLRSKPSYQ